jgi:hypothetical protein
MKKLFFIALVAVVAVGGALSSNAQVVIGVTSGYEYDCSSSPIGALCGAIAEYIITPDQGIQNPAVYFTSGQRYQ